MTEGTVCLDGGSRRAHTPLSRPTSMRLSHLRESGSREPTEFSLSADRNDPSVSNGQASPVGEPMRLQSPRLLMVSISNVAQRPSATMGAAMSAPITTLRDVLLHHLEKHSASPATTPATSAPPTK